MTIADLGRAGPGNGDASRNIPDRVYCSGVGTAAPWLRHVILCIGARQTNHAEFRHASPTIQRRRSESRRRFTCDSPSDASAKRQIRHLARLNHLE